MRPQISGTYDELISHAAGIGLHGVQDQKKTPQPAIFSIPTHATTHAPSEEYLEGEDPPPSEVQLTGRPAPTPDAEAGANEYLVASGSRLGPHPTPPQRQDTISAQSVFSLSRSTSTLKARATATQRRLSSQFTRRKHQSSAGPSLKVEETPFPGLISEEPGIFQNNQAAEEGMILGIANDLHSTPTPSAPAPISAGRFPRWRGWLERKAIERQSEQKDTADLVKRKKSWGAGVNDEDAISDGEGDVEQPLRPAGPLHTYYMGSRFISHLPSLPLCSAYLDLPPPAQVNPTGQRLLRRRIPEALKRKVLLIGTAEGLYVAELPHKSTADAHDSIRYRQVWKGVGVYQMAILTTILLALCANVKDHSKKNAVASNAYASTSNHNLSTTPLSTKGSETSSLPSTHFGAGAGGGPTRAIPPTGAGKVHMWNLEALRKMVIHALDALDSSPLDLLQLRSDSISGNGGKSFAARVRRAWASLGEPSSERRSRRRSRQAASFGDANETTIHTPSLNKYRNELSTTSEPFHSMTRINTTSSTSDQPGGFGRMQSSPIESLEEGGYDEAFRLAQSSVTIKLPSGSSTSLSGAPTNLGQSESLTSLFSDEAFSAASASHSGHASNTTSHAASKGVSFFSLFEAKAEVGAYGTWYMALATPKSIYLYEAARPSAADEARSWIFVKEFYTPLPARAIAFTYSQTSSRLHRSQTQSKREKSTGQSHLQSSNQNQQQQVKSSAYSSVFRLHYDLSLFVSFGRKAVIIKASDASVKEVDMESSAGVSAGSATTSSERSSGKSAGAMNTSNKRRSLSVDLMTTESRREQWIGMERVESEIAIRRKEQDDRIYGRRKETTACVQPTSRVPPDDDEEEEQDVVLEDSPGHHGLGVTLQDDPLPRNLPSLLRRGPAATPTHLSTKIEEPSHQLTAKLALFSKGEVSFIYPLPLPSDFSTQRPLDKIKWREPPISVTAWSRVIGLQRDLSSGPISISALGAQHARQSAATSDNANSVQLHVRLTALALFPNLIEIKSKDVKVQVTLPFNFDRDSELELQSVDVDSSPDLEAIDKVGEGVDEGQESASVGSRIETEYLSGMLDVASKGFTVMKPWDAAGDAGIWAFDWRGANDYRLFYTGVRV